LIEAFCVVVIKLVEVELLLEKKKANGFFLTLLLVLLVGIYMSGEYRVYIQSD